MLLFSFHVFLLKGREIRERGCLCFLLSHWSMREIAWSFILSFFFLLFLLPFNSLLSYYLNPPSMSSDDLFLMNPLFLFLLFVCFVNVGWVSPLITCIFVSVCVFVCLRLTLKNSFSHIDDEPPNHPPYSSSFRAIPYYLCRFDEMIRFIRFLCM